MKSVAQNLRPRFSWRYSQASHKHNERLRDFQRLLEDNDSLCRHLDLKIKENMYKNYFIEAVLSMERKAEGEDEPYPEAESISLEDLMAVTTLEGMSEIVKRGNEASQKLYGKAQAAANAMASEVTAAVRSFRPQMTDQDVCRVRQLAAHPMKHLGPGS